MESSRAIQTQRAARWLARHGVGIPMDGAGAPECVLEISPLLRALMLALDITEDTTRTEWIFQKIDKLDTTNQVKERAIRNIRQRAESK